MCRGFILSVGVHSYARVISLVLKLHCAHGQHRPIFAHRVLLVSGERYVSKAPRECRNRLTESGTHKDTVLPDAGVSGHWWGRYGRHDYTKLTCREKKYKDRYYIQRKTDILYKVCHFPPPPPPPPPLLAEFSLPLDFVIYYERLTIPQNWAPLLHLPLFPPPPPPPPPHHYIPERNPNEAYTARPLQSHYYPVQLH